MYSSPLRTFCSRQGICMNDCSSYLVMYTCSRQVLTCHATATWCHEVSCQLISCQLSVSWCQLSPAQRLGGKYYTPLSYFLDRLKTTGDIDAKLSVAYTASIWRLLSKFQKNLSKNLWEIGVLVTLCYAILGQKAVKVWKLLECTELK